MSENPTRSVSPDGEVTADQPPGLPDVTHTHHAQTAERRAPDTPSPAALSEAPHGYELFEVVGSGGMGVVYRAREIAFDRDVAVKVLQERYSANSATAQRFLDEARITAQLQNPAIPPVHHIGTLPNGRPFPAMKIIKGETLADRLNSKFFIHIGSRRVFVSSPTANPDSEWVAQQARNDPRQTEYSQPAHSTIAMTIR